MHDVETATKTGYSVGEVARMAGVTVRTLHHYGEIGLLTPSHRTSAGYRRYTAPDLDRIGRILYYRDLGFPLDEIASLLDDPDVDAAGHLRRQHRLLSQRLARTERMIAAVEKELEAYMNGINLTSEEKLEVFGESYDERWEQEAEERWGNTDAWKQSQQRTAGFTKADWEAATARMNELNARLVAGFQAGLDPRGTEAMDLAEAHRQWLNEQMDCSAELHLCIVDMYLADERFTKTYEDLATGLTQWLNDAAHANAERLAASS